MNSSNLVGRTAPASLRPLASALALVAFVAVSATAHADTLPGPVTVNYQGSGNALTANQTGTGRALLGNINNTANGMAAIRGLTNGRGPGLHGVNSGTTGPAAYFEQTNTNGTQTAVVVKANGRGDTMNIESGGPGIGLIVKRVPQDGRASIGTAIYAENLTSDIHTAPLATAISGHGGGIGVVGTGDNAAGVWGTSQAGNGLVGETDEGYGVKATSNTGSAVYAKSTSGLAGEFHGAVTVSGAVRAASFQIVSDRDQKQDFVPVDGAALLDRIADLPMSRWAYKATPEVRHLGPMAQDFRAAFGLGTDERHIEVVDAAGVSLAAVQALVLQLRERDSLLAQQQSRLAALEAQLAGLASANAAGSTGASTAGAAGAAVSATAP